MSKSFISKLFAKKSSETNSWYRISTIMNNEYGKNVRVSKKNQFGVCNLLVIIIKYGKYCGASGK